MVNKPKAVIFSQEGYRDLLPKLQKLQRRREEVLVELQRAREMGDLSENGAYKAARFELGDTDRAIRQLQYLIKYGVAIEAPNDGTIGVGSMVKLKRNDGKEFEYRVVGTYEANPIKGMISLESPMGMALTGKKIGDQVVVNGITYRVTP